MKLTPMAVCLIRTCPAPGGGNSTSSYFITSGPPVSWIRMAFMRLSRLLEGNRYRRDRLRHHLHGEGDAPDDAPIRRIHIDAPVAVPHFVLDRIVAIAAVAPAIDGERHATHRHPFFAQAVVMLPVIDHRHVKAD